MTTRFFEIRICSSCGLRYPLVEDHPFGTRCPVCMGETAVARRGQLNADSSARKEEKVEPFDLPARAPGADVAHDERGKGLAVLLDNIRSAWNVGSILRSADGFGLRHAHVCGITPTPEHEAVTKASLGAEDSVPWSYHKDAVRLAKELRAEAWRVYGLEEDARAQEIRHADHITRNGPGDVLIVGNEVTGIDPDLLDLCDSIFYIPMRGVKKSFNVAIAFSIAAYAFSNQEMDT